MKSKLKSEALDNLIDKHIGKQGTTRRIAFENELSIDLLALAIKQTRQQRKLTQTQLGELLGLEKAYISKIEKNINEEKLETILKIFNAMGAKVSFNVELYDE
jgi:DNA-binding XRE family transcriptional regulator